MVSTSLLVTGYVNANPYGMTFTVHYCETAGGKVYTYTRVIPASGWAAEEEPWCDANHRTATGQKYSHIHSNDLIPGFDGVRNKSVGPDWVNLYWNTQFPGWVLVSGPTWKYNCHGHAFGVLDPLITSYATGSDRYRTDAGWKPTAQPSAGCICSTTAHSWKVESVYQLSCPPHVKKRSEKRDESGVYEITYDAPGSEVTANLYRK